MAIQRSWSWKKLVYTCFTVVPIFLLSCTNTEQDKREKNVRELWMTYCQTCHGADGKYRGGGSPDVTQSQISLDVTEYLIKNGKGKMLPFKSLLSEEEIERMAKYVISMRDNG